MFEYIRKLYGKWEIRRVRKKVLFVRECVYDKFMLECYHIPDELIALKTYSEYSWSDYAYKIRRKLLQVSYAPHHQYLVQALAKEFE